MLDRRLRLVAVRSDDQDTVDAELAQADILISAQFTQRMAQVCRRLRLVVCPAAGTDAIDRAALPPGASLIKGTGHEIPMAEYVIGCLVAIRQRLFESDAALRQGRWVNGFFAEQRMLDELWGSNLGLIGLGGIAREVIPRARAFGMKCAGVTLHPDGPREGATALEFVGGLAVDADVDKLLTWADALVVCCELSPLTRGLLDARRFGLMKPNAALVNVARGPIVVEKDLYDALASKRIAGAAIDVWYRYPEHGSQTQLPSELPFHELDNVIMTPHASGWTKQLKERRLAWMAKVINDFASSMM
jgi:phosphoglycerate dehydrogenase-like enzyme